MGEDSARDGETQADYIKNELNFNVNPAEPIVIPSKEQVEDEWIDILGNGQLKKKVLKNGENGTRPNRGDTCILDITGKLQDGTIVDKYKDLVIQLGDLEVVQGLDLAIALMNLNEVAEIQINPRFAYGELGKQPDVPPKAHITYFVELKASELEIDIETLSIKQRKEISDKKRSRGNWWFKRNEPTLSIQCYRRALEFLLPSKNSAISNEEGIGDAELQDLMEDRMKVYNNLAAAQMKTQAYDVALESVENVLNCQPKNVKALFRKGKILHQKGDHGLAYMAFLQAAKLDPESKIIQAELAILKEKNAKDALHEKNLYRKMFGTDKNGKNTSKNIKCKNRNKTVKMGLFLGGAVTALVMSFFVYKLSS